MHLEKAIEKAEADEDIENLLDDGGFLVSAYVLLDPDEIIDHWNLSYHNPDGDLTVVEVTDDGVNIGAKDEPLRKDKDFQPFEKDREIDEQEALEEARDLVEEEDMDITKTIVSLQRNDVEYWNITFLGSAGEAFNVRIDVSSGEVLQAKKSSLIRPG